MSDQTSDHTQAPDVAIASALELRYRGVSSVERDDASQRVNLFMHDASGGETAPLAERAELTLNDPLVFREAMRVLLTLHHPKGVYLPEDPKTYEAYAGWRRAPRSTLKRARAQSLIL